MDRTENLILVNIENKEQHRLHDSEYVIGRGWLNCNDKRISRKHGILKLDSGDSISLTSTHANPIFCKTKDNGTLQMIQQGNEPTVLSAGDSFGFFPNAFWFEIVKSNTQCDDMQQLADASSAVENGSATQNSALKRKLPSADDSNESKKLRGCDNDALQLNDNGGDDVTAADDSSNETNESTVIESNMNIVASNEPEPNLNGPALANNGIESGSNVGSAMEVVNELVDNSNELTGNESAHDASGAVVELASSTAENAAEPEMTVPLQNIAVIKTEPNDGNEQIADGNATGNDRVSGPSRAMAAITQEIRAEVNVLNEPVDSTNELSSVPEFERLDATIQAAENGNNSTGARAAVEPASSMVQNGPHPELAMPVVVIKTEPNGDNEQIAGGSSTANDGIPGQSSAMTIIKQESKTEVKIEPDSYTNSPKQYKRDGCPFGVRCYRRQNAAHRTELAHPGDSDYRLPDYGDPLPGAPQCPYGIRCYRRNPIHFRQYSHPPSTDPAANRMALQVKKPEKGLIVDNDVEDDSSDNEEDPFAGGDSSDDPDFEADMLSDDESEKDSGHDSIEND